jgi:uncharacterized protein DUF2784
VNVDALFADLILLLHFAFVVFVVGGLVLIWIGYFLHWRFVRDIRFRMAHLLAMAFVLGESLLGIICPLTTWEEQLRLRAGQGTYSGSFIQHWVGRIMFFNVSERVFTVIYGVFFLLVALSFLVVKPARKGSETR